MNQQIENLKLLYAQSSKHSNYQILPQILKPFINEDDIEVKSRYEKERLDYMLKQINPRGLSFLDIGGNSGYFSFELLAHGAKNIDYYEGNTAHAKFVQRASEMLKLDNQLHVFNEYYDFQKKLERYYDVTLLLNVLHHVGDDYDDKNLSLNKAKQRISKSLNAMAERTTILIFQLGFCWKGDRNLFLFEGGTKKEMIDFVSESIKEYWTIEHIGEPVSGNKIIDENLVNDNIIRNNSLGEF
jgi:hypothetical protein